MTQVNIDFNKVNEVSTKLDTMVAMQHKLNNETIEDYLDKNLKWDDAILDECSELMNSVGFKWWKKTEPDHENAKLEVVDLWHFLMSYVLQLTYLNHKDDKEVVQFSSEFIKYHTLPKLVQLNFTPTEPINPVLVNTIMKDFLKRVLDKDDTEFILSRFVQLCSLVGLSFDELYVRYVVKNTLNKIRQDRGYKDGKYIKQWNHPIGTDEDNVVVMYLVNELGLGSLTPDQIYTSLVDYYDTNVATK